MNTIRAIEITVFVILLLVLVFFIGQCTKVCQKAGSTTITKIDTVVRFIELPPDTFFIAKPHTVIRDRWLVDTLWNESLRDTIFTALDEFITAKKDTIRTAFFFPEIMFSHSIGYKPDSIKTIIQTITVEKVTIEPRPWWEKPLYIIAGGCAGYLIGRAR